MTWQARLRRFACRLIVAIDTYARHVGAVLREAGQRDAVLLRPA